MRLDNIDVVKSHNDCGRPYALLIACWRNDRRNNLPIFAIEVGTTKGFKVRVSESSQWINQIIDLSELHSFSLRFQVDRKVTLIAKPFQIITVRIGSNNIQPSFSAAKLSTEN